MVWFVENSDSVSLVDGELASSYWWASSLAELTESFITIHFLVAFSSQCFLSYPYNSKRLVQSDWPLKVNSKLPVDWRLGSKLWCFRARKGGQSHFERWQVTHAGVWRASPRYMKPIDRLCHTDNVKNANFLQLVIPIGKRVRQY